MRPIWKHMEITPRTGRPRTCLGPFGEVNTLVHFGPSEHAQDRLLGGTETLPPPNSFLVTAKQSKRKAVN